MNKITGIEKWQAHEQIIYNYKKNLLSDYEIVMIYKLIDQFHEQEKLNENGLPKKLMEMKINLSKIRITPYIRYTSSKRLTEIHIIGKDYNDKNI